MTQQRAHDVHLGMAGAAIAAGMLDLLQDGGGGGKRQARPAIFLGDEGGEKAGLGQRLRRSRWDRPGRGRAAANTRRESPRRACAPIREFRNGPSDCFHLSRRRQGYRSLVMAAMPVGMSRPAAVWLLSAPVGPSGNPGMARTSKKTAQDAGDRQDSLTWPGAIYRALKEAKVTQACYVPDAGHSRLIQLLHADPGNRHHGARPPRKRASRLRPAHGSAAIGRCCCCSRAAWAIASTCSR